MQWLQQPLLDKVVADERGEEREQLLRKAERAEHRPKLVKNTMVLAMVAKPISSKDLGKYDGSQAESGEM